MSVTKTFTNSGQITVPYYGQAVPSTINVSGVTGTVEKISVTLYGISTSYLGDWDALLVGPGASTKSVYLTSDAGNGTAPDNLNITFDDAALFNLPYNGVLASNGVYTYKPVNYYDSTYYTSSDGGNDFGASPPPGTSLAFFNDTNVNGSWTLNVQDDFSSVLYGGDIYDHGQSDNYIKGGWKIDITSSGDPSLFVADVSVKEGDSGKTFLNFPVTLQETSLSLTSVDYFTVNGTATGTPAGGADFTSTNGTINFLPGEKTKTVSVEIINDSTIETNENFSLNLKNPVGAVLGNSQGIGTIIDNDSSAPNISFVNNTSSILEGDAAKTLLVPVKLSKSSKLPVKINYSATATDAKSGKDYILSPGVLTFKPGETQKNLPVTIVGDTTAEKIEESFSLEGATMTHKGKQVKDLKGKTLINFSEK